eukprot:5033603-Pleurochrysis_carterae.AAC.2
MFEVTFSASALPATCFPNGLYFAFPNLQDCLPRFHGNYPQAVLGICAHVLAPCCRAQVVSRQGSTKLRRLNLRPFRTGDGSLLPGAGAASARLSLRARSRAVAALSARADRSARRGGVVAARRRVCALVTHPGAGAPLRFIGPRL